MRSRTIREGSVGILILIGLGLLGGLILWLRGFNPTRRSYVATVEFPSVSGIQKGAVVQFRGVRIGQTKEIRAGANAVAVDIEISPATLIVPKNSTIAVYQTGLAGESVVEITPNVNLPATIASGDPLSPNCNTSLIVCNGSVLQGEAGVSFNQLIAATTRFADVYSSPQFFTQLNELTRNSSKAAAGVATLTGEVTNLTRTAQRQLGGVTQAATGSARSIQRAADQAALTTAQVNELLTNNRAALVTTLDNINTTSVRIQSVVNRLAPGIESGDLVGNLQTLSTNAVQASNTLRNLTDAIGSADNILLLQQTIDSARATFQNAQKITSDLDELTGDPQFRQNLRELINGLSGLVSSTQQLEQQTVVAQVLTPTAIALRDQQNAKKATEKSIAETQPTRSSLEQVSKEKLTQTEVQGNQSNQGQLDN